MGPFRYDRLGPMRRARARGARWRRLLWQGVAVGLACLAPARAAETSTQLAAPATARQLVLVVTQDWNAVDGTLQCYERAAAGEPWHPARRATPVVVGAAGLAWGRGLRRAPDDHAPIKREGDRRAPAGMFRLSAVFGYAPDGAAAGVGLPYIYLTGTTEGVDDPRSTYYNRIVDRASIARPDWRSSEKMRRDDDLYRWGVVVDHNTSPVLPGAGSCIFMHLWRGPSRGTDGCTAMPAEPLGALVRFLRPEATPVLVQLPRAVYREACARGELPSP